VVVIGNVFSPSIRKAVESELTARPAFLEEHKKREMPGARSPSARAAIERLLA
jgi:hypothetical protein